MRPPFRRHRKLRPPLVIVVGLCALGSSVAGCDALTAPGVSDPRVDLTVDPEPIRSIQFRASSEREGDPPEVTTLPREEIECLATRDCLVREFVLVTIHNRGRSPVWLDSPPSCGDQGMELFALGVWNRMTSGFCFLIGYTPVVIAPGASSEVEVEVRNMEPGRYRIRLALQDPRGPLSEALRTTDPFDFAAFPDTPVFACPNEDESERASRFAREQIEEAVAGTSSRGVQSEYLRMESEIPGYGGLYRDSDLSTVAWLTAEAREAGADSLIYEALGPHTRIRTGDFSL